MKGAASFQNLQGSETWVICLSVKSQINVSGLFVAFQNIPCLIDNHHNFFFHRTLLRSAGRQRKLPREKRKWQPKKLLPRPKNPPKSNNSSKTKRRLELPTRLNFESNFLTTWLSKHYLDIHYQHETSSDVSLTLPRTSDHRSASSCFSLSEV